MKTQNMDRYPKSYTTQEVFNWVLENTSTSTNKKPKRAMMDGHEIKIESLRYKTFMKHGTHCCVCGIEGTVFYKERNFTVNGKPTAEDGRYHFNLYAIDNENEEVLMTRDHVIAKSLGGQDFLSNMQTMCRICNNKKGSMTVKQWDYYLKNKD